jgi:hypothetical protein
MRQADIWMLAGLLLALPGSGIALAQAAQCSKSDFEAVVDEAAGALRALNQQNTPPFQAKLRQLKEKRGWGHDQFMQEAAPFVRDETIAAFDQKSAAFLAQITSGGQEGAAGGAPDCALLAELRATLKMLIETQQAKWAYMADKIDAELRK